MTPNYRGDGRGTTAFVIRDRDRSLLPLNRNNLVAAGFMGYERNRAKMSQGARAATQEGLPECSGRTRDRAGAPMGDSGKSATDAAKVVEAADRNGRASPSSELVSPSPAKYCAATV